MPGILLVKFVVKLLSTYTIHYSAEDTREDTIHDEGIDSTCRS